MILTVTLNPAVDYVIFGSGFTVGTTNRGEDIPADPGGKGNNSARIARLLGCKVMATGFLGGHTGDFIERRLAAEGIIPAFYRIAGATRITTSFIDSRNGDQTKIVPFGPPISPEETHDFFDHMAGLLESHAFSIVSMNGSIGRGMESTVYKRLISLCASRNIPVVLDTSGEALAAPVQEPSAAPFIIKPNMDEARQLCGLPDTTDLNSTMIALRSLLGVVPHIALTMGGEGAILLDRHGCTRGRIPSVDAVNPICAGDAFVGGFMAAFDREPGNLSDCFRAALAAGTATASVPGLLWDPALFNSLLKRVVLGPCC